MRSVKVERKPRIARGKAPNRSAARRHAARPNSRATFGKRGKTQIADSSRGVGSDPTLAQLPPPDAAAHGRLCRRVRSSRRCSPAAMSAARSAAVNRVDRCASSPMRASAFPKSISPAMRARRRKRYSPRSASSPANRSSLPIPGRARAPDEARLGGRCRCAAPLSRFDLGAHRREAALRAVAIAGRAGLCRRTHRRGDHAQRWRRNSQACRFSPAMARRSARPTSSMPSRQHRAVAARIRGYAAQSRHGAGI